MEMQFIHYSKEPFKIDLNLIYNNSDLYRLSNLHKPNGLWFSVEGIDDDTNWKEWCEGEKFREEYLKYSYEIKFKKNANLIVLDTIEKMWEFNLKWNNTPLWRKNSKNYSNSFEKNNKFEQMSYKSFCEKNKNRCSITFERYNELSSCLSKPQWEEISSQCDGIMIAPYQWDMRLHTLFFWYYGWDCSSGCIWNLDCIEEFKLLGCR